MSVVHALLFYLLSQILQMLLCLILLVYHVMYLMEPIELFSHSAMMKQEVLTSNTTMEQWLVHQDSPLSLMWPQTLLLSLDCTAPLATTLMSLLWTALVLALWLLQALQLHNQVSCQFHCVYHYHILLKVSKVHTIDVLFICELVYIYSFQNFSFCNFLSVIVCLLIYSIIRSPYSKYKNSVLGE